MRSLAAGCLAVVWLVTAQGCGSTVSSEPPSPQASGRPGAVASYERWAGTLADRQAAEIVVEHRQNGAYSECMTEKGYDLPWQAWVDTVAPVDALGSDLWLSDPEGPYFVTQLQAQAATVRADTAHEDESLGEAERLAGDDCLAAAGPGPAEAELEAIRRPVVVRELAEAWSAALTDYTAGFAEPKEFLTCMTDVALPGKPAGSADLDGFVRALQRSAPPPEQVPAPGETGAGSSDAWSDYTRRADAFAEASWGCRHEVYDRALPGLGAVVSDFEADHAEQIEKAARHWADVRREAEALTG